MNCLWLPDHEEVFFTFRVVEFRSYKEMQRAMRKFDGAEFFDRKLKLIDVSMFSFLCTDVEKI